MSHAWPDSDIDDDDDHPVCYDPGEYTDEDGGDHPEDSDGSDKIEGTQYMYEEEEDEAEAEGEAEVPEDGGGGQPQLDRTSSNEPRPEKATAAYQPAALVPDTAISSDPPILDVAS